MNPTALLSLISGLYEQLATAQQEIADLRAALPAGPPAGDPNDGPSD